MGVSSIGSNNNIQQWQQSQKQNQAVDRAAGAQQNLAVKDTQQSHKQDPRAQQFQPQYNADSFDTGKKQTNATHGPQSGEEPSSQNAALIAASSNKGFQDRRFTGN